MNQESKSFPSSGSTASNTSTTTQPPLSAEGSPYSNAALRQYGTLRRTIWMLLLLLLMIAASYLTYTLQRGSGAFILDERNRIDSFVAASPDGRSVALLVQEGGKRKLYVSTDSGILFQFKGNVAEVADTICSIGIADDNTTVFVLAPTKIYWWGSSSSGVSVVRDNQNVPEGFRASGMTFFGDSLYLFGNKPVVLAGDVKSAHWVSYPITGTYGLFDISLRRSGEAYALADSVDSEGKPVVLHGNTISDLQPISTSPARQPPYTDSTSNESSSSAKH